ncbi:phytoene/squalene synthetase [Paramagnetospirillum kuznetsovii]|uniref:Phytoene/squalene synthetase n=1 Tax=Paramagnetospirillum kuznetsovii TaxID=2053833 RepID=A0A364NZN7_9PROT|nr:phytoene/squalene synthetase [Paramagnetospirillum kuznetsovii]
MMAQTPNLSHCAGLVRDFDRDRFMTALFAPPDRREALMALYAFNVEIARIRESVREPMAGLIRLQWWRDTFTAAEQGRKIDRHPVALPLVETIRERGLSFDALETILTAREVDLESFGPGDLAAVESYAENTSGILSRLALGILGSEDDGALRAAHLVGTAWALIGQARAVPFHLSMGRLTLPEDVLVGAKSSGAEMLAGQAPPSAIAAGVKALGERAAELLGAARRLPVAREALPGLLLGILADCHLAVLRRCGWNPFDPRVSLPRHRPLRLAWARWRGRF